MNYSSSLKYLSLSFVLYEGPTIENIFERWSKRSTIAFAITESPNTSPHFLKLLFVVIIVGCFSYHLLINWKNKFESSFEIGKNPTSSIINTL